MEKQVVRFPRATTGKDDICYKQDQFALITSGHNCSDCRVHIVTDRFLSKHFQKEIMKDTRDFPMGTYPYVLIVDTSLCNLRCRACYSSKYWKPESNAKPVMVSPETLSKQFRCKIEKLHEDELVKPRRIGQKIKRPFSRLRVSGGEPLFENGGNSMDFWLSFLKKLDNEFNELIFDSKVTLKSEKEWVSMPNEERESYFPVFLKSDNNKIRIRFDTNGWLFKNKEFAKSFIGGIYDLDLKNIKIDLIFSLKGTNKYEVDWFVNPNSEIDSSKIGLDEPLEEHPQWEAINNIVETIKSKESQDILSKESENVISETYFNPCGQVSLTVERGIMNNPREKLYLYNKGALNWDNFAKKLKEKGILLSETENCIYLGQFPAAIAWRYINAGNYELRLKCPHHKDKPFLSYSKEDKSVTESMKHRQILRYSDPNLKHLSARLKIQNGKVGDKCKYSDKICDYWIEILPCKPKMGKMKESLSNFIEK